MNYENHFTRTNPGLVIIMVDQSKSMEEPWCNGKTLAEQVALSVNRFIAEMGMRFTSGDTIKESANIVIIGYGGKPGYNAQILREGSIREYIENPIRHETIIQKLICEGQVFDIDIVLPINIEPCARYASPMASAFKLAASKVKEWILRPLDSDDGYGNVFTRDASKDSVPLIINISGGEPTDSEGDVRKYAKEIMETACPDGNPLIFNILLSAQGGREVSMPMDESSIPAGDKASKLLFDISSRLPEPMVQVANAIGFPDVVSNVKTFMSNVPEITMIMGLLPRKLITELRKH